MKTTLLGVTLVLFTLTAASVRLAAQNNPPASFGLSPAAPVAPAKGPLIQMDNAEFDFGKATLGEPVRHSYLVTNTGDATLIISAVRPGCHCTTVGDWTHEIAPGSNGQITVQFDTASTGGGGTVSKNITVDSNAKNDPHKTLMLKGTVWKPIEVTPAVASITIPPDAASEISTTLRIVNHTDTPVAFSNVASPYNLFRAALKETTPGKEYALIVTAVPPFPEGNSQGNITFNTSLPGTPSVSVTAVASVTPAVQIYPNRIILNSQPNTWMTNAITIHGNTTNVLVLSNPKFSDSRVQLEIRPTAVAGMFSLVAAFPPGYHLEAGQQPDITVECNHPRLPLIKIPVMDFPRKPASTLPPRQIPPRAATHP